MDFMVHAGSMAATLTIITGTGTIITGIGVKPVATVRRGFDQSRSN
jgi:hypothetical protein